jgi:hypothetical protein
MFVTILYTPFRCKTPETLRRDKVLFADKRLLLTLHGKHYSTFYLPSGMMMLFSGTGRVRGNDIRIAPPSLARLLPRKAKKDEPTTRYRPHREPFKSRWRRLHVRHLAALKVKDFGLACALADKKFALWEKDVAAR